jgi:hypothetical protein
MDDFFDDLDEGLLCAQMEASLQIPGAGPGSISVPGMPEETKNEENSESDHRTIERVKYFELTEQEEPPHNKQINHDIIIKEKLGEGGFCKVKHVSVKVNRYIPDNETGEEKEVGGEQQLAVKIFNRKKLQNSKT